LNWHSLLGATVWTEWLFYISIAILFVLVAATIFTILNHRFLYDRHLRPHYDLKYRPRCSIILPCKGIPKDLRQNLDSFLTLDYPDYEVIYAVESEIDPAVPIIREVIAKRPGRGSMVVAGFSKRCAQKNFNQIAAIEKANKPDVYVFADADIEPSTHWLKELILPLSNPKITATTGFRWQYSKKGTVGEQVHSYINNILYIFFTFAATVLKVGLWGETVVDDMSLSQLIMKSAKKSLLVTTCVTTTDDALQTVKQSVNWFMRQCMFLKGYHGFTWMFLAIPLASFLLFLYVWLPISLTMSRFSPDRFLALGGGASLVFVVGAMLSALLYQLVEKNPRFFGFFMLQPYSFFSMLWSIEKTLFTNTIVWSGIKYTMSMRGIVTQVERPAPPPAQEL
jgi:glycosyltransferase involved in cell wall biosynthesis